MFAEAITHLEKGGRLNFPRGLAHRWEGTFSLSHPSWLFAVLQQYRDDTGGCALLPPPISRWERVLWWQQDGSAHSHLFWVSLENSPPKPTAGTGKPNECRKQKFALNLHVLTLLLNHQQTATT